MWFCISQILDMFPPDSCSAVDRMILWPALHSSEIIWGKYELCKYSLGCFDQVISCETASSSCSRKHSVIIYIAQKCLIFSKEDISMSHLPVLAWYFIWDCLLFWLCMLIFHACSILLYRVNNFCPCVQPIHWICHRKFCFSKPIWLLFNCFSICPCNKKEWLFFCLSWQCLW